MSTPRRIGSWLCDPYPILLPVFHSSRTQVLLQLLLSSGIQYLIRRSHILDEYLHPLNTIPRINAKAPDHITSIRNPLRKFPKPKAACFCIADPALEMSAVFPDFLEACVLLIVKE